MNRTSFVMSAFLTVSMFLSAGNASAAFSDVCSTVKTVKSNEFLYKSEISAHIPSHDPRAAGPTLVCNKACPARFPAVVYYSDGNIAARLGYYGKWNVTGKSRAYCATGGAPRCTNRALKANSKKTGRNGKLYIQFSRARTGASTVCYAVNPTGRTGAPT